MDLASLTTLPDETDETLGGLLTAEELLLEISTMCRKYTPEQRIQAATVWVVTGNVAEVERQIGIPKASIYQWKRHSPWWKELVRQVRKSKQDELDGMLTGLIMDGAVQLRDRVANGNTRVHISEDGQRTEFKVPLTSGELAKDALGIPFDKRALLRGDPTSRTEKSSSEETNLLLQQLADNFKKFAAQVKPQYIAPAIVEGEFEEITDAQEAQPGL